jgi:peptide deformylase
MSIKEIIKLPHPTLRRVARKIVDFDSGLHALVEDMIETMRDEPGVGLAAPQVNISQRLIVVEYPDDDSIPEAEPKIYVLINPDIVDSSDEKVKGIEGCLSVPNLYGDVERSQSILIEGQTQLGKNISINAEGWLARIFQHEIDHLNGVLFVDRAEELYQPNEIPNTKSV